MTLSHSFGRGRLIANIVEHAQSCDRIIAGLWSRRSDSAVSLASARDQSLHDPAFLIRQRLALIAASEGRSDWALDPIHQLQRFTPPRRVPHGITFIGRLFDEGTLGTAGRALEKAFNVASENPKGF